MAVDRGGTDRIVQTFTFDGQPDGVALETLWFEDGYAKLDALVAQL